MPSSFNVPYYWAKNVIEGECEVEYDRPYKWAGMTFSSGSGFSYMTDEELLEAMKKAAPIIAKAFSQMGVPAKEAAKSLAQVARAMPG